VRDIVAVSDLPVLVDGDNGYGDVKNVVHVLHGHVRTSRKTAFHGHFRLFTLAGVSFGVTL
jgi:hypothetical protein